MPPNSYRHVSIRAVWFDDRATQAVGPGGLVEVSAFSS
jgi:hypothetical protein